MRLAKWIAQQRLQDQSGQPQRRAGHDRAQNPGQPQTDHDLMFEIVRVMGNDGLKDGDWRDWPRPHSSPQAGQHQHQRQQ